MTTATTKNGKAKADAISDESESSVSEIVIHRIGRAMARIEVEGTAPLIVNRFAEKAREQILGAQMGRKKVRENKDPEQCYQGSLYKLPDDRYGFPAVAFKSAVVGAARYFDKVTMTALKQMIFVKGEGSEMLVPVDGTPRMREDMVRNQTGVVDTRFRGEFWPWKVTLELVYIRNTFNIESLLALVDAAGIGGVGEWRPSAKKSTSGMYGTFAVCDDQDVKEILL